jgi:hypothetical protein
MERLLASSRTVRTRWLGEPHHPHTQDVGLIEPPTPAALPRPECAGLDIRRTWMRVTPTTYPARSELIQPVGSGGFVSMVR